jgi:hypothetical protein
MTIDVFSGAGYDRLLSPLEVKLKQVVSSP